MIEFEVQHSMTDFPRRLAQLPRHVRQEVLEEVAPIGEDKALELYQSTTRTWSHDVRFRVRAEVRPTLVRIKGGTDDAIYRYVDEGTRAHIIEPIGVGYPLRFQSGYQAKTTPGVLGSRPGGPKGNTVYAMRVRHPGTRARRFSKMVSEGAIRAVRGALSKVFGRALKRGYQKVKVG